MLAARKAVNVKTKAWLIMQTVGFLGVSLHALRTKYVGKETRQFILRSKEFLLTPIYLK